MTIKEGSQKLATALLLPINPAAVVLLGIYTVVWGAWVANPFWSVFGQAQLYSVLASAAPFPFPPEAFWGLFAILCGLITIYGAYRRNYRSLINGAAAACWHWMMIAVFYFLGDPASTGGITALFLAIYAGFIYLNVRVNFKSHKDSGDILHP